MRKLRLREFWPSYIVNEKLRLGPGYTVNKKAKSLNQGNLK